MSTSQKFRAYPRPAVEKHFQGGRAMGRGRGACTSPDDSELRSSTRCPMRIASVRPLPYILRLLQRKHSTATQHDRRR